MIILTIHTIPRRLPSPYSIRSQVCGIGRTTPRFIKPDVSALPHRDKTDRPCANP